MIANVFAACAIAVVALGCTSDGGRDIVRPGDLHYLHWEPMIDAPSTAPVSTELTINVSTYGGGCVWFDRTDIEQDGDDVVIRPFDREHIPGENEGCDDPLILFPHPAVLMFDSPGPKNIRVAGRSFDGEVYEDIEVPVSITIQ
ncbi:MAG TPA: hypothetical protein VGM39_14155 [Kofleriaceae bacterium]|jgi:hypothetical protein